MAYATVVWALLVGEKWATHSSLSSSISCQHQTHTSPQRLIPSLIAPHQPMATLWTLLKEFIPMFDQTKPSPFPSWPAMDDIFQFAGMVLMYCDMSMHKGPHYTDTMKSRMFLSNLKGRYHHMALQCTALVGTYCPGSNGVTRCMDPLPQHLTVMELARTLSDESFLHNSSSPTVAQVPQWVFQGCFYRETHHRMQKTNSFCCRG